MCPAFGCLNTQTKYHMVYEALQTRLFFPGELIAPIAKRSVLNKGYEEFYRDRTSKFKREIDQKKVENNATKDGVRSSDDEGDTGYGGAPKQNAYQEP